MKNEKITSMTKYILEKLNSEIASVLVENDPDEMGHIEDTFDLNTLKWEFKDESEVKELEEDIEKHLIRKNSTIEMAYVFIQIEGHNLHIDIDLEINDDDDDDDYDDYDEEYDDDEYDY